MISNKTASFATNKSYVARSSGDIPSKLSLLVRGCAGCVIPHSLPSGVDCPLKRRGLELNCRAMGDMEDDTVMFLAFCCIGWTGLEGLEGGACPSSRAMYQDMSAVDETEEQESVLETLARISRCGRGLWFKISLDRVPLYVSYTGCWSSINSYWGSVDPTSSCASCRAWLR